MSPTWRAPVSFRLHDHGAKIHPACCTGAGAAAQNAIGTAVTGGLLSATFIDLVFIPFFFVLVSRLFLKKPQPQPLAA